MCITKAKRKGVNGMEAVLITITTMVVILKELLIGFASIIAIAVLIQLISYRIFNFNLYKKIKYVLIDSQIK